jgi:hypothetical protein
VQSQLLFERELEAWATNRYARFDAGGPAGDLGAALAEIGQLAQRWLRRDLVQQIPLFSVWPLGSLLDPDPAAGADLLEYFDRRGRFAVLGERFGGPVELMLVPRLCTGRIGPQDAHLVLTEAPVVKSYLQYRDVLLSGAALHRFLYVDLAAIEDDVTELFRRLERHDGDPTAVLADPAELAPDRASRRSLDEPAEITIKLRARAYLEARAFGNDPPVDLLFDAVEGVLQHELVHLEDADRYLPLGWNLLAELPMLIANGFQPRNIEAWLEMRAQCAALVRARNPFWILANCTAYLPRRDDGLTPHGDGYAELLGAMVAWIDEHPESFPSIDRDQVILQQLDRLNVEEIRWLARAVARQIDLPDVDRYDPPRFRGMESRS